MSTTFANLLTLTGAFDFNGTALNINFGGNNTVGTTMEVTNSGLFTTANGANLTIGTEFVQNGAGLNSLGGNLASTNDGVAFATGVTLSNGITMTTGLGALDDIVFSSTLDGLAAGAQSLGLTAGAGNITFNQAVGGTRLGAVTVTSAGTVLASSTFNANSYTQAVGTVATTFTGVIDLTTFFDFNGTALSINGTAVANQVGTTMDVTNAGLFTTAVGANLTVGNQFTQDGAGLNSLGGDIDSTNDGISFDTELTLTNDILMTTGEGAGDDIVFGAGITGTLFDLGLTAGTGGAITGTSVNINNLTLNSGASAAFTGAMTVNDLITTANNYTVSLTGTGNTFAQNVDFLNSGTVTLGNATADTFLFNGGLNFTGNASVNLAAAISSSGDVINFGAGGVTLLASSTVDTTNAGGTATGAAITFDSTLNGQAAGAQSLGLTAGAGNITFNQAVGGTRLGAVTVTSAGTVLASSTFNANSFLQSVGTVSTTFANLLTLTGAFDFNGTALNINFGGNNTVGTTMEVTNSGLFTTANGANLTIGTEFVQNGAGLNSLGGNLASTNDGVAFATGVTLSNGITMTTGLGALDDIVFSSTLDGLAAGAQSLGLTAGAGNITFNQAVGGTRLGAVTVTSAGTVLASSTFNANSYTQAVGTVATTFANLLTLTGAFNFTGTGLTIGGTGANLVGGSMTVTNAGAFTTGAGDNLTVGTEFIQNGAGLNSLGGNIASTADGIAFATAVTLSSGITMTTGEGAGDDIVFGAGITGTLFDLGLTAGTGGAITGTSVNINNLTLNSGASAAFTGAMTVNDLITTANNYTVSLTGTGNTFAQNVDFLNSGTVTLGNATADTFLFNGGLNFTGNASVNLAAAISSSGDVINFGAGGVTLLASSTVDTTNAGGTATGAAITFGSALNGTVLGSQTLGLTAGAGNITLTGAVGGTTPLGAVTVNSAENITALNSGNRFSGLVTIGSSQNTALYLNAFDNANLGSVVANQNFTLVSNDALTLNGVRGSGSLSGAQISGFSVGRLILNTGSIFIPADFNYPNIQNLSLSTSSGGISGDGVLTVPNLTLQSSGQTSLSGGNKINNIESIVTGAGLELVNSQNLSLNGIVQSAGNNVITVAGQLLNNTGSSTPFAGTTGSTTLRMLSPFVGGSLSPVAGFSGFTPGYNGVNPGAQNSIIYAVSPLTMFAPSGTVIAGVDLSGTQTGGGQLNTFFTGSDDLNWIISDFAKFNLPKVSSAGLEYTIYPKRVEPETRTLPDSTLSQLRKELGRPPTIEEINRREVSMRQSDRLRSGSILERSSLDSAEESNEPQENAKATTPSPIEGQVPQANQGPKKVVPTENSSFELAPPMASSQVLPDDSFQPNADDRAAVSELLVKERANAEVGLAIPVARSK